MKKIIIPLVILSLALTGCASLKETTQKNLYNGRSDATVEKDLAIERAAQRKIDADPELNDTTLTKLTIVSFRQNVLLAGQAQSEQAKKVAGELIASIPGVKKVNNEIEIRSPINALAISNDAYLTTIAKAALTTTKGFQTSNIKVVTVNDNVYLLGIHPAQAEHADALAGSVIGVNKVINIFEPTPTATTLASKVTKKESTKAKA